MSVFLLHALSPLHVGTGQAADIIDLPIARQRATGLPYVPGSAIKGVLRDTRRSSLQPDELAAVFGPDTDRAADHAGALAVGDARLLALPVRSFRGTFAWVTSPFLLRLAQRELRDLAPAAVPQPQGDGSALVGANSAIVQDAGEGARLYLEDLDLQVSPSNAVELWATYLAQRVWPTDPSVFTKRFAVADDETMTFLWETATQLDTRVRLNSDTRTVAEGALWVEESLPPETVLLGLLAADQSRRDGAPHTALQVLQLALPGEKVVQLGGKATTGRGRCRIIPL